MKRQKKLKIINDLMFELLEPEPDIYWYKVPDGYIEEMDLLNNIRRMTKNLKKEQKSLDARGTYND